MSTDGSVQTAEGSSRKRLKISRTAGRPLGSTLLDPIAIKSDPPAKTAITDAAQPKDETSQQTCHHEQSLRTLHTDLDDMRQIITCRVCQRFLYEPYTLTCGHTFCYSCLSQWMGQNRKKTCPDCRTIVHEEPTPAYLIKQMVFIFVKRSELLPDGETSEEHHQMATEEAEIVTRDKANLDDLKGGLFMGAFKRRRRPLQAIHDPSDHVDRCPQCLHEVEDGYCLNCHVRVLTEHDDSDYSGSDSGEEGEEEEDSDVDHELAQDNPGYVGFEYPDSDATLDDEDIRPGPNGYLTAAEVQGLRNEGYRTPNGGSFEGESSDEADPEMEGFIDDDVVHYESGEDNLESEASVQEQAAPRRQRRTAPVVLSDDDDDDDDDVQVQVPSRRRLVTRRPVRQSRVEILEDSSNSDSDDEPVQRNSQRARGGLSRAVGISSSEESSDDDEADGATPRRYNFSPVDDDDREMQRAMHNSIHPESDESDDNSEDESEVMEAEHAEDSDGSEGSDESDQQSETDRYY